MMTERLPLSGSPTSRSSIKQIKQRFQCSVGVLDFIRREIMTHTTIVSVYFTAVQKMIIWRVGDVAREKTHIRV